MSFISGFINLSVGLVPAAIVSQGLGAPAYLCIEGSAAISGGITTVSNSVGVAALLTATNISAAAAADLTAAFAQDRSPALIHVATYDTGGGEDPSDALGRLEAAATDFGPFAQESRANADNATAATWVAASQERRWSHMFIAMSAEAELITSGKPAALAACEIDSATVHYHSTGTVTQAAAQLGQVGGFPLISGPMGTRIRIQGVALPVVTSAEKVLALANDVVILKPLALGVSAADRIIDQTRAYSGNGWTGIVSLMYTVRRCTAALQSVVQKHSLSAIPLFANSVGAGEVRQALTDVLAALSLAGHYQKGSSGTAPNVVSLPQGYRLVITTAGTVITAAITVLLGQEAVTLNLTIIGEEQ
jgi:hypothetical protein